MAVLVEEKSFEGVEATAVIYVRKEYQEQSC